MAATSDGPVFHVEPKGWLANRMIQYMVALTFQSQVPGSRISNVQIPEWDIDHPPLALPEPIEPAREHMHIEMAGLVARARAGELRSVVYSGYGQRMENFLDVAAYRTAFRAPVASAVEFDERYLVCHVRANEVIYGTADPHYPLTPVEYYAAVVEETGLIPVFTGQTAPNAYMDRLREQFPRGIFLETGDVVLDFEIIRRARNIAIGVSTYAWLAAWLSHADRIFMAVSGLFNPMQYQLVDLLPFGDPRYRFYLFPINFAVPFEHHAALHRRIAPLCRMVPQQVLQRMFREAPRFDPPVAQMLEDFDPAWYAATYPDVAHTLGADNVDALRSHYQNAGVRERRKPFELSETWYAAQYPTAALEVAQGDYSSFAHHYVAVGRASGYRPMPPDDGSGAWWQAASANPMPIMAPGIGTLAKEVIWLEREAPFDGPGVSLGESFTDLLEPAATERFAQQTVTGPMRLYRLRETVLDASMMALLNGRHPIRETLYMMNQGDYQYALAKPLHPEPTDGAAHYILGANVSAANYFHWMTQCLPAIDWGLRLRRHPHAVLALPPLRSWHEEGLALLGHAAVRRLTLNATSHYALASVEYSEFLGDRLAQVVSRSAAATYARLRDAVPPATDGADEIYVARTDASRRVMANEAALIAMLERQGVRIIVPGALPVTRQLALFRRARLVIGAHGAGLSNIMGCEPGAHLYELLPSHYPNACFNRLAQACGLHYWGDAFQAEAGAGDPHGRGWRIDLDTVAARLDEIRARMRAPAS